jgi:hypothetical protein
MKLFHFLPKLNLEDIVNKQIDEAKIENQLK